MNSNDIFVAKLGKAVGLQGHLRLFMDTDFPEQFKKGAVFKTNRKLERERRHIRVRRKISGTSECPRLCVYRSNSNIYAQIIDDVKGETIVSASTLDKAVKTKKSNKEAAKEVGTLIAKRAIEKNIKNVVYDRGGYIYHGIVKELAEAAREAGLEF